MANWKQSYLVRAVAQYRTGMAEQLQYVNAMPLSRLLGSGCLSQGKQPIDRVTL